MRYYNLSGYNHERSKFCFSYILGCKLDIDLYYFQGINLYGSFDLRRRHHIEVWLPGPRHAMCTKLGAASAWFICGGETIGAYSKQHGVYLKKSRSSLSQKCNQKRKQMEDVYEERNRGTATIFDEYGKTLQKKASYTEENNTSSNCLPHLWWCATSHFAKAFDMSTRKFRLLK